ncbi:MAG: phage holin family protein [Verrucomicrobia bacterium]|nr:phage holin family protein [Verrucomicrobiota bacterium]
MSDSPESRGLLATLRGLASTVSSTVSNRLELLLVELQIERVRFLQILVLLLVTLVLAFLAILTLTAAIVVALWKTSPVLVLLVISFVYAVGAWLAARQARVLFGYEAFAGSLSELKKDQSWLNQTLSGPSNSGADSSSPKAN